MNRSKILSFLLISSLLISLIAPVIGASTSPITESEPSNETISGTSTTINATYLNEFPIYSEGKLEILKDNGSLINSDIVNETEIVSGSLSGLSYNTTYSYEVNATTKRIYDDFRTNSLGNYSGSNWVYDSFEHIVGNQSSSNLELNETLETGNYTITLNPSVELEPGKIGLKLYNHTTNKWTEICIANGYKFQIVTDDGFKSVGPDYALNKNTWYKVVFEVSPNGYSGKLIKNSTNTIKSSIDYYNESDGAKSGKIQILHDYNTTKYDNLEYKPRNPENTLNTYTFDTSSSPIIANRSPSNNTKLQTYTPNLEIGVKDNDFKNSDNVTVEYFLDDESVHNKTISSNQTVTYTPDKLTSGDHTWSAELRDEYGNIVAADEYILTVPGQIYIRDAKNATNLINTTNYNLTSADVSVEFYHNDEVIHRTVKDGVIDLTGLPAYDFVIDVDAENWSNRRIYLESIFNQNNIFLLQKNNTIVEPEFVKSDYTGNYPDEPSILLVEKSITFNNETEWRLIEGDYFGASGSYPAKLEKDKRHRLIIQNTDTGDTRILGTYIPQLSRTVELEIGGIEVGLEDDEAYEWELTRDNETQDIILEYVDDGGATTNLDIFIYEQNNSSNILVNTTHTDTIGEYKLTEPLNDTQMNKTWVAELEITRDSETFTEKSTNTPQIDGLNPFSEMGDTWKQVLVLGLLLMLAGLFSEVHSSIGAIVLALVGTVFWWLNWLPVGIGIIVFANVLAIGNHLASKNSSLR